MRHPPSSLPHLELWYQAYGERFGIRLRTSNVHNLINALYRARTNSGDPDLDGLSIVRNPYEPSEVWIIKRKPNGAAQEGLSPSEGDA